MAGESEQNVAQELSLADEDRLPWLEAVDSDEPEPGVDTGKILGFVIAALLALGVIVGGIVIAMFLPIFKMSEIVNPKR